MASPERTSPCVSSETAAPSRRLRPSAFRSQMPTASRIIPAMPSQKDSPVAMALSFQSSRAVCLPSMSPRPAATMFCGALQRIAGEESTASGCVAS